MSYINVNYYGGLDWHDIYSYTEQVSFENEYEIPEEKILEAITEDIFKYYPFVPKEKILDSLINKTEFQIPLNEDGSDIGLEKEFCENEFIFNGEKKQITLNYFFGQVSYNISYSVYELDKNDICYLISENFLCPTKGTPLVERMYQDVFIDKELAEKCFNDLQVHNLEPLRTEKTLNIQSLSRIKETDFYKENMKANQLMKNKKQTPFDESFRIFVESHIKELEKL